MRKQNTLSFSSCLREGSPLCGIFFYLCVHKLAKPMKRRNSSYHPKWRPGMDRRKVHRRRVRRTLLTTLLIVVVLAVVGLIGLYRFAPIGKSGEGMYVYVTENTTADDVLQQIEKRILVRYPGVLHRVAPWVLRTKGQLQSGRYRIEPSMSLHTLFATLTSGEESLVTLQITRGIRTQEELIKTLTGELRMKPESLRERLQDLQFCTSLGMDTITIRTLFMPNEYKVRWDISPDSLVALFHEEYKKFWTDERKRLATEAGFSPAEIITIASIVQEESAKKDEHSTIAGLYINRLREGMKLQADPTARYAYGDFTVKRIGQIQLSADSPYNTYKVKGLPPGPICYPEQSTIDSVLHYKKHDYRYMCARADFSGYHAFASNYMEHKRNAKAYQAELDKRAIK